MFKNKFHIWTKKAFLVHFLVVINNNCNIQDIISNYRAKCKTKFFANQSPWEKIISASLSFHKNLQWLQEPTCPLYFLSFFYLFILKSPYLSSCSFLTHLFVSFYIQLTLRTILYNYNTKTLMIILSFFLNVQLLHMYHTILQSKVFTSFSFIFKVFWVPQFHEACYHIYDSS